MPILQFSGALLCFFSLLTCCVPLQVEKPTRSHERRYSSTSPVPQVCVWEPHPPQDPPQDPAATMTVSQSPQHQSSAILLAKRWGPERVVKVRREHDSSLGISIVGGKVSEDRSGGRGTSQFKKKMAREKFCFYSKNIDIFCLMRKELKMHAESFLREV